MVIFTVTLTVIRGDDPMILNSFLTASKPFGIGSSIQAFLQYTQLDQSIKKYATM